MSKTLDLIIQLSHGIASHFGNTCEIVIHDLTTEAVESSVVHIENGHISNRTIGDGPSGVVLEALQKNPLLIEDHLSYLTKTDDGRILKSSTMYIRNDKNVIEYIFAINYDITALMSINTALNSLIDIPQPTKEAPKRITHNVNDLLDTLIEQSVKEVGKPVAIMTKDDKITAIKYLNDAGAFLVTRSGDKVSNFFGISKFTLYSYLDTIKNIDKN